MKRKRFMRIAAVALFSLAFSQISAGGQPGVTDTTFNRRFIPTIKPMMTYEQVVGIVGVQGVKVEENKNVSPSTVQYRWKGGRNSVLTATFSNNRLMDATVVAPNTRTYRIKNNGEVVDITK
jgi:hypothetical protein